MISHKKLYDMYTHMHLNSILEMDLDYWDLLYLLKLNIKTKFTSDTSSIIHKICKIKNIDNEKMDIIRDYHHLLSNADVRCLSQSLSSDIIKRDSLDYFLSIINTKERFYKEDISLLLSFTIGSVINSKIRKYLFEKYVDISDSRVFASYIGSLKQPKMMEEEFLKYKHKYRKYNLSDCVDGLRTDELRFNFFTKYYTKYHRDNIKWFICYNLESDEYKALAIDKYIDSLTDTELFNCISSFDSNKVAVDYIEKYYDRIFDCFGCYDFKSTYRSFTDQESIIRLIELLVKNKAKDISDVIIKLDDESLRMKLFEKYFDMFDSGELWTIFCYFDTKNKKYFANKYKDYLQDYVFERFITFHAFEKEYVYKNFIDKMSPETFRLLFYTNLYYEKNAGTLMDMLDYLLSFTNDYSTKLNIFNGFALNEPEVFLDLIYENFAGFTREEKNVINKLYSENKNLFKTLIFQLVKIPYIRDNYNFLKKLSVYPNISIKVSQIYKNYPKRFNLLLKLFSNIFEYDINTDELISLVVNYFNRPLNLFLDKIDLTNITDTDVELLIYKIFKNNDELVNNGICLNKKYSNIDVEFDSIDTFNNYYTIIEQRLEEAKRNVSSLNQYKNIILFDLYGMNLNKAYDYIDKFGESVNKLDYVYPTKYIFDINRILKSESFDELSYYYANFQPLSFKERYLLGYKMKKYFMNNISESLYKINQDDLFSYFTYGSKRIPVYKPKEYFFLIHSLMAYNGKNTYIDTYDDFWNYNSNVQNHGICCSLISNQNIGQTAPINDVVFGFDSFSDNAINIASNNDLGSQSDDYCSRSFDNIRFMLPKDYINTTRHSHNELVLERKELRKNKSKFANIQPSYIIVYSYFDEKRRENSYKAAIELNVPIVYIDTYENALREVEEIKKSKDIVDRTYDIDALENYIFRYENNYHGYYFIDQSLISYFFSKSNFKNNINDLLDDIYNNCLLGIIDVNQTLDFYNGILRILDKCSKYTLQYDEVKLINYKNIISITKKHIKSLTNLENKNQRIRK